jgi:deoxyribonuclease V
LIAFLDVDYRDGGARAACVLVRDWTDPAPASSHVADIDEVRDYEPGKFYLRELPCLQSVLGRLPEKPDVLVVDGYVWLADDRTPGLGARLHEASGEIPVVGVAKTKFRGMDGSSLLELVFRGRSARPLYLTAVGIDPKVAASALASMPGEHRIPDIVRRADRLARSVGSTASLG